MPGLVSSILAVQYTGSPPIRVHEGTIEVPRSDLRYCADGFEINCGHGEKVRVTFSLDCCDRRAIAFAATTAGISRELVRAVMVKPCLIASVRYPSCPSPPNDSATMARATLREKHGALRLTSA
jgi:hypothetical protein